MTMKKKILIAISIVAGILVTAIISGVCVWHFMTNNSSQEEQKEEITLTADNFRDYFAINVDCNVKVTEHSGSTVAGVYLPGKYSAVANIDLDVLASIPLDAYNVKVTIKINKWNYKYWETKTVTLSLSSDGSASKSITISSSKVDKVYRDQIANDSIYAEITKVEGTIIPR